MCAASTESSDRPRITSMTTEAAFAEQYEYGVVRQFAVMSLV